MKFTQQEVASKIGVSQSAYNYWESGKHLPSLNAVIPLAEALNIPYKDLLFLAKPEEGSQGKPD